MTEQTAGFGWLPASVLRRQAIEDQAERREARAAEAEREAQREQSRDRGLAAYRAAAEARGETVSAMALATGQGLGRSIEDVFGDAIAAADHEDARQAARAHREAGVEPGQVGRADGWPESPYELSRMLRQADELHRSLVQTQSRLASRQGRAAEHIEAHRTAANSAHVRNSGTGTITRFAPTPVCDACGYVLCKCR